MASTTFNPEAYNADVRMWGQATLVALKSSGARVGSRGAGTLIRMLKVRFYTRYLEIYGLGFQFPRYGVFLEKGARRGHGGIKGSRWFNPNRISKNKDGSLRQGGWVRTDPRSLGKMGTGNSPAIPWFNPVVDARMGELADAVARHYADMAVNAILIR